ncbi:uncharacterized protein LOC143769314 isoform X1 [Ranitomeya variabilis]|uniref:uncharacterized protein LOC143769314 isoform X1 n=1 Tax=Ranitomeya variabilis TaxID=490064 RepID=UPI00405753F8
MKGRGMKRSPPRKGFFNKTRVIKRCIKNTTNAKRTLKRRKHRKNRVKRSAIRSTHVTQALIPQNTTALQVLPTADAEVPDHESSIDSQFPDALQNSAAETPTVSDVEISSDDRQGAASQFSPPQTPDIGKHLPFLEHLFHIRREMSNLNAYQYIDHFRFVNLDRIRSFEESLEIIHGSIQTLLDRIMRDIDPGNFIQLRLEGDGRLNPVYGFKQCRDNFDATAFLNAVSNVLQSNAECIAGDCLKLIVSVVRNRRGGTKCRRLRSIVYTRIIHQKRQMLFDFNNYGSNQCLAASLYILLAEEDTPDADLMKSAAQLHRNLKLPDDQLVSFCDIIAFETYLNVTIKVLYFSQGDWRYFHTDREPTDKILYILHHENHYYGIKNIKGFIGAKFFCEKCSSAFHHKNNHSYQYFYAACQRADCAYTVAEQLRCPRCRVFCRSASCLELHRSLAETDWSFCKLKFFCEQCYRYIPQTADDEHRCVGVRCTVCGVPVYRFDNLLCYMQRYMPKKST